MSHQHSCAVLNLALPVLFWRILKSAVTFILAALGGAMSVSMSAPTTRLSRRFSPSPSPSVVPQRRGPCSVGPLKGVVAIVDVRVGADAQIDCSDVVARKLRELGASTVKRFTSRLTHVVLSHFTPVWKTKIGKWQAGSGSLARAKPRYELQIVSQLWVNACYVSKERTDERPFFPVSRCQVLANVLRHVAPKGTRQEAAGRATGDGRGEGEREEKEIMDAGDSGDAAGATMVLSLEVQKERVRGRRKRRALSMEPIPSDAVVQMLGKTDGEAEMAAIEQRVRMKRGSSLAKRRNTLNGIPSREEREEDLMGSEASEIVAESASEKEMEDERKEGTVILESRASCGLVKEDRSPMVMSGSSTTLSMSSEKSGTPDKISRNEFTARELRRRNRTSLSYGTGLTLKSGIWSCAACGCSNPRTRRHCTDCQVLKGSAKSPCNDVIDLSSPAAVANAGVDSSRTPTTPGTKTMTPTKKISTPSSANRLKSPISSSSVLERTPRSLTRPTASSAAKVCTPSPAASRIIRPATKTSTPNSATRTQSPALRNCASKQTVRSSLASASVSTDVQVQKRPVKNAQRRLPATTGRVNAMKLTQSAAKKRARPPVGASNALTTPVVKKTRRDSDKEKTPDKYMATPGSVSGFQRKHRDVNSTPIPMAMNFSSTTSRKTPRKTSRNVIAITGVSAETRGVLQCAIHAIDANMSNDSGHRKARVVKSVDYTAGLTHLIVGKDARRTIKVLFAIARGAWIVSEDWAFSSLEQERWLPEETYELTMFANKYAREHPECRQIFKGMKVHVGSNVDPSREVLHSLVQVAGGEICNQISVADICICGDASLFRRAQRIGIKGVTSKWVFDSIAAMKLEGDAKHTFVEPIANTPIKSRQAAISGLEAHSTVSE